MKFPIPRLFVFNKKLDALEKANYVVLTIIRLALVIAIVTSIFSQDWEIMGVTIITLILTFIPTLLERKYDIDIPEELEITTVLFIFATLFLGEVRDFYNEFWAWDLILHFGSSLALGFIGFIILYVVYKQGKIKAMPVTISIFTFAFAMSVAGLWEIVEFTLDSFLGWNMQKSGLQDTMGDLIIGALGALFAAIIGYFYLKKGEKLLYLDSAMKRFIRKNPKLFKKK